MIAQDTEWQMRTQWEKNTHQLVKRFLHVDAALGGRLKERHSKTLRKVTPLHVRHLTVVNEIALRKRASEGASIHGKENGSAQLDRAN